MSGLMLCSRQADKPYYISELDIRIYSIEEMAYYLYNNVYFVGKDFFNEELAEYIRCEFHMPRLAEQIEKNIKFGSSYAEFVMLIIKASDYYNIEEIRELEYILEKIGNKTVDERMMIRADIFMKKGKYASAFVIYRDMLNKKLNLKVSEEMMAQLWYNMGIICGRKFSYGQAAACFEKSCDCTLGEKNVEKLLMAYMLAGESEKITESAVKYGIADEKVERIRLRISEAKSSIRSTAEYAKLGETLVYDGKINLEEFYQKMQDVIDGWKEEYREEMT